MFALAIAQRWRPSWLLASVLLAASLFLVALAAAVAALRGPRLLGYHVAATLRTQWWRVTDVWPGSFAWDAGIRAGLLLHGKAPPATQGTTVVYALAMGRCCRAITLPLPGQSMPELVWLELSLAAVILILGVAAVLFARDRLPALFLLLFCLATALALCGVTAFARGAIWGSLLFEFCWFALLPPLTLLLANTVPPGGRSLRAHWAVPVLISSVMVVGLQGVGLANVALYTVTRDGEGLLFVASQTLAISIWVWRALPARGGAQWPEYRLVLGGLGGSFGGFALLAVLPASLQWRLPWPTEASGVVLVFFPLSISWALLRYRLFPLRRYLQRTAITLGLLMGVLGAALLLAGDRMSVLALCAVILLTGMGVPLAQSAIDRLLPDSQATYATLLQRSGERLGLVSEIREVTPILEEVRRSLGLAGLCLRRDNTAVLLEVGVPSSAPAERLVVRYEARDLAVLEVGEKLRGASLLGADREALTMLCQQLGAFLARQQLTLQLRETIAHLTESQRRLLTAQRLERERLDQRLHRGPLQEIILLLRALPAGSAEAEAATRLMVSLRAILTETASATLRDLGLPAALRAYLAYLAPYARDQGCALSLESDDALVTLADDESFVLYQLAHEALTNAVRHSGARQVQARLVVERQMVTLEVRDDGGGLPSSWLRRRADHRGLRDTLDLVRTVSGAVASAESAATGGTVIRASVPLRQRPQPAQEEQAMHRDDTIRILIAEDHDVVRQGLRRVLTEDPRLVVVGEASTGHEILSLVLQHQPDVLLLDLDLPGQSGLAALKSLRAHVAQPPRTLVLSAFHDEEYVRQAHELQVAGFLSKGCDDERLRGAIHKIMAGAQVLDPTIATIVHGQRYSGTGHLRRYADGSEALSAAELAVLEKMRGEQTYEEIAEELKRSHGTVRSQAATVCQKLGVSSRQQAVLKALQLGILHLEGL